MISLYSLIWTIVISCPLILLIFVLRRKSTYLMKYGVTFICILYAFCAVRMLIPIEVPAHQKVICDPYVYSYIMRAYALLDKAVKHKIVSAIIIVWIIGSIVTAVYYWITVGKRLINLRKTCYKGDGRAERILKEIDSDSNIQILYTDLVTTPLLVGIFNPTIYMTGVECTDKQIEYILMHEYTHWKRKDPWKQLLSYLMVIAVWWNPLFRLLNTDIKRLIEMGCDKTMLREYPKRYALEYLKTMCHVAEAGKGTLKDIGLTSLNFINMDSEEGLKQRFYYALDAKDNLEVQKKINLMMICLCLVWMMLSYRFILQPVYSPDREIEKLEKQEDKIFKERDTYLEKRKDGTYIFHYGKYSQEVSEDEIKEGLYREYLIIEEK